jgi:hypothetical protein
MYTYIKLDSSVERGCGGYNLKDSPGKKIQTKGPLDVAHLYWQ